MRHTVLMSPLKYLFWSCIGPLIRHASKIELTKLNATRSLQTPRDYFIYLSIPTSEERLKLFGAFRARGQLREGGNVRFWSAEHGGFERFNTQRQRDNPFKALRDFLRVHFSFVYMYVCGSFLLFFAHTLLPCAFSAFLYTFWLYSHFSFLFTKRSYSDRLRRALPETTTESHPRGSRWLSVTLPNHARSSPLGIDNIRCGPPRKSHKFFMYQIFLKASELKWKKRAKNWICVSAWVVPQF